MRTIAGRSLPTMLVMLPHPLITRFICPFRLATLVHGGCQHAMAAGRACQHAGPNLLRPPPSPTHTYTHTHTHPPRPQPPYLAASPQVVSVKVVPGKHAILTTASGKLYQADAAGLFELTGNSTDSADVDIWAIGQGLVFSPVSCVWALSNYCVNNAARKLFDSTCQGQDPTWAAPNCELRCVNELWKSDFGCFVTRRLCGCMHLIDACMWH
jgi:hypothetical protein